ncbi:tetratricopeptide repeat protein [Streptacidiphilus sp. N1-12]|uniref:Tetratricopeptide repeat protein n=2 Tax=Streptacidiphilus alkalitolerans TaxID=3342712 RepID=A0ABV6VCG0_9ACTN
MQQLRQAMDAQDGGMTFVLHGLGGCGKTAVALEAFRYAEEEANRLGLWVNASDTASLRSGMLAVAADRGAREGELTAARSGLRAAADLVWQCLDASPEPWILVLDNADDPVVLRDGGWLRSSPRGLVLVTSRQAAAHWWPGAQLVHVGVLPLAEAARVLCDLAPASGTMEEAERIAERLGRLPLALTLAGGFLSQQVIRPWTMSEYSEHLGEDSGLDRIELIDRGASASSAEESRHLLSTTWQISLDGLAGGGLPEAVDLLRLLACWAGDPLPIAVLADSGSALGHPEPRMELALRGLIDRSLTEIVPESRCLRTHAVLLDSVALGTPMAERARYVASASALLAGQIPAVPQRGRAKQELVRLVPHALALVRRSVGWVAPAPSTVRAAARSCLHLVVALHRSGDATSAHTLASVTLRLVQGALDDGDAVVLELRQRIGRSLHRMGRFEDSAVTLRAVLADTERVFGQGSLEALQTAVSLSRPLVALQQAAEAADLVRRTIAGREELLGPEHPVTLIARAIALESCSVTELNRHLPAGRTLVETCRTELGPDHAITLMAELDYAYALRTTGHVEEALPQARWSFEAHERMFGAEHPISLSARTLLAQTLDDAGAREEALRQAEMVLRGRVRVLGQHHPWTVAAADMCEQLHAGR